MTFTKVNQKPLLTGHVQLHVTFACRLGEYTQYIYIYIFIYIDTHICIYILLVVCDKPPRHVTNTGISLWDADTHFRMWEAGESREFIFLCFFFYLALLRLLFKTASEARGTWQLCSALQIFQ